MVFHYIDQVGLNFTDIHLPLPPSARIKGVLPCLTLIIIFCKYSFIAFSHCTFQISIVFLHFPLEQHIIYIVDDMDGGGGGKDDDDDITIWIS